MKLKDLLKQSGIEMGKVYTDKTLPPFKVDEASDKIQVQGVGVYSYDVLVSKVTKMAADLLTKSKKKDFAGLGSRTLQSFGAMWDALATHQEKKR